MAITQSPKKQSTQKTATKNRSHTLNFISWHRATTATILRLWAARISLDESLSLVRDEECDFELEISSLLLLLSLPSLSALSVPPSNPNLEKQKPKSGKLNRNWSGKLRRRKTNMKFTLEKEREVWCLREGEEQKQQYVQEEKETETNSSLSSFVF